jgi:hydroxyethylthiazole kinase-like uncharacterized protein yjeF
MIVVTADEMRAIDAWTIRHGTPGRVLMARAAAGAVAVLRPMLAGRRGRIVVLCGKGNNGGDGLVMATLLRRARRTVEPWIVGAPDSLRGDAQDALRQWRRGGGRVHTVRSDDDVARLRPRLASAAFVVDALLGTGLSAEVTGLMADVIGAVNATQVPVLAVDIASGLSADTGRPLGTAVQATATAAIGFHKVGQCQHPGIGLSGAVHVVDIGFPAEAVAAVRPRTTLLEAATVRRLVRRRVPDSHKGTYGHVLIVAGSAGKLGAALLAAEGAARAGAGLTTLAVPASLLGRVDGRVREVMTTPLPDAGDGTAAPLHPAALRTWLEPFTAIVCGPGLGQAGQTRELVAQLLAAASLPVVLDADGLNAVAGTSVLGQRTAPTIATPHPGEMSRLLACTTGEVQADRLASARRLAARDRVVAVLKGAGTVIASPAGEVAISPTGNPGMATGGMGDALAGLLGGLLAQGLEAMAAASLGVYVHGLAGDRVADRLGPIGLLAGDVIAEIPATVASLLEGP